MKYIVNKLNEDFIFEELEQARIQFVDALSYTMKSANIVFDDKADDALDIYIEYDFQQKEETPVVYGFNLFEEIVKHFGLDTAKTHSSEQLLNIGNSLRQLSDEIESRFDPEPTKTLADIEEKKDKKRTEFAENINRSYKDVLKAAKESDSQLQNERSLVGGFSQNTLKGIFKKF